MSVPSGKGEWFRTVASVTIACLLVMGLAGGTAAGGSASDRAATCCR